jgi:hypothetical protein
MEQTRNYLVKTGAVVFLGASCVAGSPAWAGTLAQAEVTIGPYGFGIDASGNDRDRMRDRERNHDRIRARLELEIATLHTGSRGDIAAPALPISSVWTRRSSFADRKIDTSSSNTRAMSVHFDMTW